MKHAIIVAHPNVDSFTLAIAQAYERAAVGLGHTVVVRDLYRLGFDPRLPLAELPGQPAFAPGQDVVAERGLIGSADVFVFVYPLWLNAPPAMLKGYLDRVFGWGFAYGPGEGGSTPLLRNRMMISLTSSGAPAAWVRETGSWDAICKLFDEHVAGVCGLTVVDHIHFGEIVPGITAESVQSCADDVADKVRRHFAPAG